jgi:uncharacterized protein YjbI with pentapeptide repeats
MAEEHEETSPTHLSREELEGRMANAIFIKQGPAVFEQLALHPSHREGIAQLDGNYAGINLDQIIARGAILESVHIPRASFCHADLSGADCCSSDFRQVDCSGAHLSRVNFSASYLNQANFDGADLTGATMVFTYAIGANFHNADLSGANMEGCILIGASFAGANLTNANLAGATMLLVDLTRATLTGATLTEAGLVGAYIYETVGLTPLQQQEAGNLHLVDGAKSWRVRRNPNPYEDEGDIW